MGFIQALHVFIFIFDPDFLEAKLLVFANLKNIYVCNAMLDY